jgi:signal transduction histidine kinase
VFQGRAVAAGFCCMKDYHHFTQDEIDMVMGIANSGAIAVENARLHEYSIQLATAKERNRLAQEMHDGLAQALAVTKLNLNSILAEDLSNTVRSQVVETKKLVDDTYEDIRDTIFGLRAINDLDSDFLDNFKGYLSTFGIHNNLEISFSMREQDINVLSRDAVLQVGRIIEEALSNIKKHSRASHVWLESGNEDEKIWISIRDDGIGYLVSKTKNQGQNHFGIAIMRERAESIGGNIQIDQLESGGTCVRVEIPYSYT